MTTQYSYLRDLQNRYAELMTAYKALEALEEKRIDTGLQIAVEDLAPFSHLTADNVTNAQFSFAEIKTLMTSGHRANINKILP